jgi:hypothetical protein
MDVLAYLGVIRRQWIVVLIGLTIAQALALMAVVRVTDRGLQYRSPPIYAARSTLFVTQGGFPWGRSKLTQSEKAPDGGTVEIQRFADPGRMEYLASLYSELARTSRAVQAQIERAGKLPPGAYQVTPLTAPDGRALPLIEVMGVSQTPSQAVVFSNRVADGLRRYVRLNQLAGDVPQASRIQLPFVTRARSAEVLQGVKLTRPILIFFFGSIVTLVFAFARDNMQRRNASGSPGAHVQKLEAAPHVVEGQLAPSHEWNRPQTADRSSG